MAETARLGLPLIAAGQAGAHVTVNTALSDIDNALGRGFGALGGFLRLAVHEADLSALSGSSATAAGLIPARCIVLGVTCRTLEEVTGATSYDCGSAPAASEYGGSLGVAAGSENVGVIGPAATYAPGDVVLTANGGSFTGGRVLVVAHVLEMGVAS